MVADPEDRSRDSKPGKLRTFLAWKEHRSGSFGGSNSLALPVGIAYADLAGVPTVIGMYSAIFPLFAYALFGSSRQLIVGPDTATCLIVAASLGPLAGGDPDRYASLLSALTLMTAFILIMGGFAKLGFMANFLSQPILTGYLNGVGLIILVGQFPKLLGISIDGDGFFPEIGFILSSLGQTHLPTVCMGCLILLFLVVTKKIIPVLPGALLAVIGSIVAVKIFSLNQYDIAVLGEVSPGLPKFRLPHFEMENFGTLISDAAGIGLVSFTSGVLTSKRFARRNRYRIDANQELIGFGASNLASRPLEGELGQSQLVKGYRSLRDFPEATTIPGLLLYRFDANLIFFNIDYFTDRLRQAIDNAKYRVEWVVLDASPINAIDATALRGLLDLIEDLEEQGVSFYFARSKTGLQHFFRSEYSRELREKYPSRTFYSLQQAVNVFEKRNKKSEAGRPRVDEAL